MPRQRTKQPVLAALVDHEADADRVYRRALAAFIDVLVADLSAEQAMTLANTARSHTGVLVFTKGGLGVDVRVEFGDALTEAEATAAEERARAKPNAREFKRERGRS